MRYSNPLRIVRHHVKQRLVLVHLRGSLCHFRVRGITLASRRCWFTFFPSRGGYSSRGSRVYVHCVTAEARWRYILLVIPNFLRPIPTNLEAGKASREPSREPVARARRQPGYLPALTPESLLLGSLAKALLCFPLRGLSGSGEHSVSGSWVQGSGMRGVTQAVSLTS